MRPNPPSHVDGLVDRAVLAVQGLVLLGRLEGGLVDQHRAALARLVEMEVAKTETITHTVLRGAV
jgi:hypothetical protein